MYPKLEECTLITNLQYFTLVDPIFRGQTELDENNMYYMVWESKGRLYKTYNHL
jgi:hypothetical protein